MPRPRSKRPAACSAWCRRRWSSSASAPSRSGSSTARRPASPRICSESESETTERRPAVSLRRAGATARRTESWGIRSSVTEPPGAPSVKPGIRRPRIYAGRIPRAGRAPASILVRPERRQARRWSPRRGRPSGRATQFSPPAGPTEGAQPGHGGDRQRLREDDVGLPPAFLGCRGSVLRLSRPESHIRRPLPDRGRRRR